MAETRIRFTVDEHLPRQQIGQILSPHTIHVVDTGTKDPAILKEAEADGVIVVSADHGIYDQLRRYPSHDKGKYKRAGVVRILGTWALARRWRPHRLPIIESVSEMTRAQDDERVVMHIRDGDAICIDP